jgi:hypothetical protein
MIWTLGPKSPKTFEQWRPKDLGLVGKILGRSGNWRHRDDIRVAASIARVARAEPVFCILQAEEQVLTVWDIRVLCSVRLEYPFWPGTLEPCSEAAVDAGMALSTD